jgi:hypothetical protein
VHISNTSLSLKYAFPSHISLLSSQRCCASGRRLPLKTTRQLKRQNEIKIVVKETLNHPPCQPSSAPGECTHTTFSFQRTFFHKIYIPLMNFLARDCVTGMVLSKMVTSHFEAAPPPHTVMVNRF